MIAYKNGKAIGQVTEILMEQRIYDQEEIRLALKQVPPKTKRKKERG